MPDTAAPLPFPLTSVQRNLSSWYNDLNSEQGKEIGRDGK